MAAVFALSLVPAGAFAAPSREQRSVHLDAQQSFFPYTLGGYQMGENLRLLPGNDMLSSTIAGNPNFPWLSSHAGNIFLKKSAGITIEAVGRDVAIESVTVEYTVVCGEESHYIREDSKPELSAAATDAAGSPVQGQSGGVTYTPAQPAPATGDSLYTGATLAYNFDQAGRVASVYVTGDSDPYYSAIGAVASQSGAYIFLKSVDVAYSVPAPQDGASPADKGTITVSNPQEGETYSAYKILDLASFRDADTATGEHKTDAYSYAIHKDSPWLGFVEGAKDASGNKLFTVDKNNPVKMADTESTADYYVVEATDAFKNAFKNVSESESGVRDETGNAVASSSLVQKFAQDARKYVADWNADGEHASNRIAPAAWGTGPGSGELALTTDGAAPSGSNDQLALGYYLIDTSTGSLCALDTTNKDVTVFEKNDLPDIDKKVQEDRSLDDATKEGDLGTGYQKVNDATVGQVVCYRTTIDVEKGAQKYVLHDKMDAGLTYDPTSLRVWYVPNGASADTKSGDWTELGPGAAITFGGTTYLNGKDQVLELTTDDFYKTTPKAEGDTFTVRFEDSFLTFLSDRIGAAAEAYDAAVGNDMKLVIEYHATLNEKARVRLANTNETWLVYGDQTATDTETTHKFTDTYTWPVQVYKHTGDIARNGDAPLAGAKFELYEQEDHAEPTLLPRTSDGKFRFFRLKSGDPSYMQDVASTTPQYMVVGPNTTLTNGKINLGTEQAPDLRDVVDFIETSAGGKFIIAGLDEGTYYLHEKEAPKGYNRLAHDIRVTVASDDITPVLRSEDATPARTVTYANKAPSAQGGAGSDGAAAYGPENPVNSGTLDSVPILNQTGAELPSTGGIGTTIFYVAGTVLVVGAAVMLVAKRRMSAEA